MELREITKEELVTGYSYLVQRKDILWSIAQFFINEHGVVTWYHQDGLTDEPNKIYELPINMWGRDGNDE